MEVFDYLILILALLLEGCYLAITYFSNANQSEKVQEKITTKLRKDFMIGLKESLIIYITISSILMPFTKWLKYSNVWIGIMIFISLAILVLHIYDLYFNRPRYQKYIRSLEETIFTNYKLSQLFEISEEIYFLESNTFTKEKVQLVELKGEKQLAIIINSENTEVYGLKQKFEMDTNMLNYYKYYLIEKYKEIKCKSDLQALILPFNENLNYYRYYSFINYGTSYKFKEFIDKFFLNRYVKKVFSILLGILLTLMIILLIGGAVYMMFNEDSTTSFLDDNFEFVIGYFFLFFMFLLFLMIPTFISNINHKYFKE